MFKQKTVFVLGAGASKELGLPLGDTLTLKISEALALEEGCPYFDPTGDRLRVMMAAITILKNRNENLKVVADDYVKAARGLQAAMPLVKSIDNYLDSRRDFPMDVECGKLGIAWAIAEAEKNSSIWNPNFYQDDLRSVWHRSLLNSLTTGLSEGEVDRIFENVSFVIFNYDRCLEQYLYATLPIIYPTLKRESIVRALNAATFVHPYGPIGRLPWQKGKPLMEFGTPTQDQSRLVDSAQSLNTYTEGVGDNALKGQIVRAISEAHTCVFLGFAFHPPNMELLSVPTAGKIKRVLGTSLGASGNDIEEFQYRIRGAFKLGGAYPIGLHQVRCKDLFLEYSQTIAG